MVVTGSAVAFLILVVVILPILALQSAKRLGSGALPIAREQLFVQVIGTQAFLFAVTWFTARENGIELWARPRAPAISWTAAAGVLVVFVAGLKLRWRTRSPANKARLYSMIPHSARERWPYAGVCVAAGIAEEIVYRGVLTTLLEAYLGNLLLAALLSAVAFGLAHSIQGPRAVIATASIAVIMQALVALAASLIPAMVVHALYDFVAGIVVPRWYERENATSPPLDAAPEVGR